MKKQQEYRRTIIHRKSKFLPRLIVCIFVLVVAVIVAIPVWLFIQKQQTGSINLSDLYRQWDTGDYQAVYDSSAIILKSNPFHNTALTFHGYASFYLSVGQTDTVLAQQYLDNAIISLRIAALSAQQSVKPQIYYMLGKSYFYKNTLSAYHYYSDLAIKYLNYAKQSGYTADDIPEYLGLSYASLDMTKESIAAFTEALLVRESDVLLLAIAEQYYKNQQLSSAKAYLHRISTSTQDDTLRLKSSALLGQIYLEEQNYIDAEKEFRSILEKDPNFADAYYGLGVIYEKTGDLVKARAEWRKALRLDVNHQGALKKIAEYQ